MKLHHFITATVTEEGTRARELGKALAPAIVKAPTAVQEVKLADLKPAVVKKTVIKGDEDLTQQIRDYAVHQMDGAEHSSHLHRKIRHYG